MSDEYDYEPETQDETIDPIWELYLREVDAKNAYIIAKGRLDAATADALYAVTTIGNARCIDRRHK